MKKIMLLVMSLSILAAQTVLIDEDFETALSQQWEIQAGWSQYSLDNNGVMKSNAHSFMVNNGNYGDFNLTFDLYLLEGATLHINTLVVNSFRHYFGINSGGIYHHMQDGEDNFKEVNSTEYEIDTEEFQTINLIYNNDTIDIFIGNNPVYHYKDSNITSRKGHISFEGVTDKILYLDNLKLLSNVELNESNITWEDLGGPMGGIGYDLRFDPEDNDIMFVTDNHSGVGKSLDRGKSWLRKNSGITIKGGTTSDDYNIFSLTIDPNDSDIVWAGTQGEGETFGVFKSIDGGESWKIKLNGISIDEENDEVGLIVRGFTVLNGDSDTVYVQTEIKTPYMGREFGKSKGRVYKTTDGGENWSAILDVDSLTRYLIIDPEDNKTLYVSTGIFDVEASNSNCTEDLTQASNRGGTGVYKTTDGGTSWAPINTGLGDLYVGSLRMDSNNNQVLFAGTGNNACSILETGDTNNFVGLYKTSNGGANWKKVISQYQISAVNVASQDSNTVYAAGSAGFFASLDGGESFTKLTKPDFDYGFGPDGINAGFPIDLVVDPDDKKTIYINNYGGGVIKSSDGGKTWIDSSKGFSGATISKIHVDSTYPSRLYTIGRSGPFVSDDCGTVFEGIHNFITQSEYMKIVSSAENPDIILLSSEFEGNIMRSEDRGKSFKEVLKHTGITGEEVDDRFGFKAISFSPSEPNKVIVGIASDKMMKNGGARDIPLPALFYSDDMGKTFTALSSEINASVNEIVFDQSNSDRYMVATVNGLYVTTDGGSSFSAKLDGKWIEDIAICHDCQEIYAGIVHEGIYKSNDFGQNWSGPFSTGFSSSTPYITAVVFKENNSSIVYASDYYSGVYVSVDGAKTWQTYPDFKQSGLLNRAVVDVASVQDLLYAATEGSGVFRLGKVLESNIPDDNATSISKLNISMGWNLLALPVDVNITFEELNTTFPTAQTIWMYVDNDWQAYGKDELQSTLSDVGITQFVSISKAQGFWINSSSNDTIEFSGNSYTTTIPTTSGWHLLGAGTLINAVDIKNSNTNIQTIWTYNNGWYMYGVSTSSIPELQTIQQGQGFWINVK